MGTREDLKSDAYLVTCVCGASVIIVRNEKREFVTANTDWTFTEIGGWHCKKLGHHQDRADSILRIGGDKVA